jgi:hypothetical protein
MRGPRPRRALQIATTRTRPGTATDSRRENESPAATSAGVLDVVARRTHSPSGDRPDLLESCAQLVGEKEAGVRPVRAPPTHACFGFQHRARRQLDAHGTARNLAQSSSSATPSGAVLRVEADDVRAGEGNLALWSSAPRPALAALDTRALRRSQGPRSGVSAVFGQWRSDESDDVFEQAISELL